MILGMITVFSFLLIMIVVLKVQAFIVGKINANFESDNKEDKNNNNSLGQKKIAVIAAAIKKFKQKN
tara:strand:+ start:250 stop:450 length:201 start_codon:yes stop_codon:yes gene_type:complete